jgi:hypothetical protein
LPSNEAGIPDAMYKRPWRKSDPPAEDVKEERTDMRPETRETGNVAVRTRESVAVSVHPFTTFSGVDRFRHALDTVSEIRDVRTKGFQAGVLHLEIACEPKANFQSVFSRVPGFRCEVTGNGDDSLDVEVEEAA